MVAVSLEFFPPKDERAENALWGAVERLSQVKPDFVSVTYGAGGSTRVRTHGCVRRLVAETKLNVAAHLTCVGASRTEIDSVIEDYAQAGVKHIVALRGDMPDMGVFVPHEDGYQNSLELIAVIAAHENFDISVAAYPEKHPDATDIAADIDYLKRKIEAGARRAICQFVFDMDIFLRFRDRLVTAGISTPIIPAIMPMTNFSGVQRMAAKCGANIPAELVARFEEVETLEARKQVATQIAIAQCETLLRAGASHIHFYTLNQADVTYDVCNALNLGGA